MKSSHSRPIATGDRYRQGSPLTLTEIRAQLGRKDEQTVRWLALNSTSPEWRDAAVDLCISKGWSMRE